MRMIRLILSAAVAYLPQLVLAETYYSYYETMIPKVSYQEAAEIFGDNLNPSDQRSQLFLLAVSMQKTSGQELIDSLEIGIPYIVDKGPTFWQAKLAGGENSIEVLANNAILLLLAKDRHADSEPRAFDLLETASNKGYWPASFYVADRNLEKLAAQDEEVKSKTGQSQSSYMAQLSKDTAGRFTDCAEVGYAPCQYKLGFWLAANESTAKQGLITLMSAINITVNDARYKGLLDKTMVAAAAQIVFQGDQHGIDSEIRSQYADMVISMLPTLEP